MEKYAYLRGVKNGKGIFRVVMAIALLLMVVLLPHHHHRGGAACWALELCAHDAHPHDQPVEHSDHGLPASHTCSVDFTPQQVCQVPAATAGTLPFWLWVGAWAAFVLNLFFPSLTTPIYNRKQIPLLAGLTDRHLRRRGPPCFMV